MLRKCQYARLKVSLRSCARATIRGLAFPLRALCASVNARLLSIFTAIILRRRVFDLLQTWDEQMRVSRRDFGHKFHVRRFLCFRAVTMPPLIARSGAKRKMSATEPLKPKKAAKVGQAAKAEPKKSTVKKTKMNATEPLKPKKAAKIEQAAKAEPKKSTMKKTKMNATEPLKPKKEAKIGQAAEAEPKKSTVKKIKKSAMEPLKPKNAAKIGQAVKAEPKKSTIKKTKKQKKTDVAENANPSESDSDADAAEEKRTKFAAKEAEAHKKHTPQTRLLSECDASIVIENTQVSFYEYSIKFIKLKTKSL